SVDTAGFIAALERRQPDVVVVNIRIGKDSGIDILKRVKTMRNGTPVFIIEDQPEVELAVQAMKAGATDVITKPIDSERLLRLMREAVREDVHVGAIEGGKRNVEVRGFAQLTPREREVLQLITNG